MDYKFLDELLKYFSEKTDYRDLGKVKNYFSNYEGEKNFEISVINLYELGLLQVLNPSYTINQQKFLITFKGRDCVIHNISVEQVYLEKQKKENLENKILEGNALSHNLNLFQLFIAGILLLGTFVSIFYQCRGNQYCPK